MTPEPATLILTLRDSAGNAVSVAAPGGPMPRFGPSGRPPALGHGEDLSRNTLTLEVLLQGWVGALGGFALRLHPDEHLLAEDALNADDVTVPPDWKAQVQRDEYTGHPALVLACEGALLLDGSPHRAAFHIRNLKSGKEAWPAGSITVWPENCPGAAAPAGLELTVHTVGLAGPLEARWAPPTTGEILITRDPARPVRNTLRLTLTNGSAEVALCEPQDHLPDRAPVVHFRFLYAAETPGYGKLCTTAAVEDACPEVELAEAGSPGGLSVRKTGSEDAPSWSLPLCDASHALLDPGGSVEVVFRGVVSDLPLDAAGSPDATWLIVRWENIPGLADGEHLLPITKTGTPSIYGVSCTPPQSARIDRNQEVTVAWHTRGAARSVLLGGPDGQHHVNDGDGARNEQVIRPHPGHNVFRVLAYESEEATAPSAVSPPLAFVFNGPRIDSFAGVVFREADQCHLDLSWNTSNADYCLLSGFDGQMLAPDVVRHRIEPTPAQPLLGTYTLTAVSGDQRVSTSLGVAEIPAIACVKELSDKKLGFESSESGEPPEVFTVPMPPNADSEMVLDALLQLSRNSDYVMTFGTYDMYPDADLIFSERGLKPLFPGKEVRSRQGWYENRRWEDVVKGLTYWPSDDSETAVSAEKKIIEEFKKSTREQQGLVIYCTPDSEGWSSASGVYILGGIDLRSGWLVGFMVQLVHT